MAGVLLVVMGFVGSVLFARNRYNYWKLTVNSRPRLFVKCIFAGLGLFLGLCLIIFIASSYWW